MIQQTLWNHDLFNNKISSYFRNKTKTEITTDRHLHSHQYNHSHTGRNIYLHSQSFNPTAPLLVIASVFEYLWICLANISCYFFSYSSWCLLKPIYHTVCVNSIYYLPLCRQQFLFSLVSSNCGIRYFVLHVFFHI